jgi:hypothetical protein
VLDSVAVADRIERRTSRRRQSQGAPMTTSHRILIASLAVAAVAAAAVAVVAVSRVRAIQAEADAATDSIHDQLDALDPVARAAVIARLTKDAADEAKARTHA